MAVTADGMLLYGLLDVRRRYLRYLGGLGELRRGLDPGELRFLGAAEQAMRDGLEVYERELGAHLRGIGQIHTLEEPGSWDGGVRELVASLTRSHFQEFDNRQQELFPFLPLGPRPTADVGFFLARVFDLSPTRRSHRERFALTYGRFAAWDSRGFLSQNQAVAMLPLPFSEALTPLRWPLMVHELGHWFKPGGEPLNPDAKERFRSEFGDQAPAAVERLFEEILSDAAAFRRCGMAYAYALATEAQLLSRRVHAAATLGFSHRLRLLGDEASQLAIRVPQEWRGEEPPMVADVEPQRFRDVAAAVLGALQPEPTRHSVVERIRRLLRGGEPASGVHMWPAQDTTDLERIKDDEALRRSVFLSPVDVAATDQELLEAAWLEELDREPASLVAELQSSLLNGRRQLDDEAVDEAIGRLAKSDTAVSRSLQAAAVHRWLVEWDGTIAERVASADSIQGDGGEGDDGAAGAPDDAVESSPLSDLQLVRRMRHADRRQRLVIRPLIEPGQIGGTTIDLRLGTEWEVLRTSRFQALDPGADPEEVEALLDTSVEEFRLTTGQNQGLILHPGELLLALTLEYLRLPDDVWGNLEGRSTWARLGLQVHATAGMVDCGFEGYLTLELQNTGRLPLVLTPGLRVAQMAFFLVEGVVNPYHGRPTAAYSEQTKARSAFPRQHEHRALHDYLDRERRQDREPRRGNGDPASTADVAVDSSGPPSKPGST